MSESVPPRAAPWVFDVEADYRAVRRLDPGPAVGAVEALLAEAGDAAERFMAAAIRRRDLAATLGAGAALKAHGRLTGANLAAYAGALAAEGMVPEALEIYRAVVRAAPDSEGDLAVLAEICGAAGEFDEGRAAADRANLLKPDLATANIARRLKWIGKLWRRRDDLIWDHAGLLVEGCTQVGAIGAAAEALQAYAGRPPAGEPTAAEAQRMASKALLLDLPAVAAPLIARLSWAGEPAAQALAIECLGRSGDVAGAARLADVAAPGATDRSLRKTLAAAYAAAGRPADAVRTIDALVVEDDSDFPLLIALQRSVGQYVLSELDLPWGPPRPPKVINLLPFYNEHMLLDLRLAEMGEWVDHFVIAEAAETFTGRSKPLHFAETRERFAGRGDQLLNVGVERFPEFMRSAWTREFYQRDMAVAALAGIWRPDDVVLITDADEIVDRRAFADGWPDLANLRMATSQFFFNYVAAPNTRHGDRRSGAVCRASALAQFGSSYMRSGLSAARKWWESAPGAGWHFTSLTDAEGLAAKFSDFSHQEESKAALRDVGGAGEILAEVRAGRRHPGWSRRPVDERLPRWVRDNEARLANLIL